MGRSSRRQRRLGRWVFLIGVALYAPASASAATYFVRVSGDDSNDGLTPATARASVRATARMLQQPGDRLIVGPGSYQEGNVMPRGSGTPEAPIVLHGDISGELTGDPPGPVVIVPPNTPAANNGFIVYGRHDVIIENFDIEGADDAAMQVRPHSRTGVDSFNITIRNNNCRNGRRRGIRIVANGNVTAVGNTITGFRGIALTMDGYEVEPHVVVSGNVITANGAPVQIQRAASVTVVDNDLRSNRSGLGIGDGGNIMIARNQILAERRAINAAGDQISIADNTLQRGGTTWAREFIKLTRNEFVDPAVGFAASVESGGTIELIENQLPRVYTSSPDGQLILRHNNARFLDIGSAQIATLEDNVVSEFILMERIGNLALERNRATSVQLHSDDAVVRENVLTGDATISADTALVSRNHSGSLTLNRFRSYDRRNPESFVVEGNVVGELFRIGEARAPVEHAIVGHNTVAGRLRIFAQTALEARGNEARGITCVLTEADSRLILADNTSTTSTEAGLVVVGSGQSLIENNISSDNADNGLATRSSRNLTIIGNTFEANPQGGISIQVPLVGDCNDDFSVSIGELTTIVRISLGQSGVYRCRAADIDGDDGVAIDEVMRAIGAAFERADTHAPHIEIRSNRVEDNGRFGIDVRAAGPVVARDNQVLRNGGIALSVRARGRQRDSAAIGNVLGASGAEGLLFDGLLAAEIRNNVIVSNREAGILLRNAPRTAVINNLIYANGDDGISIGVGAEQPAQQAVVANNTIYANAGWGLTVGTNGVPSTEAVVRNNIIDANLRGGVAAARGSADGLALDYNLRNDANYESVPGNDNDFEGDPLFVSPAGVDGLLGGEGFEDDNLRLQPNTPARDAGSAPAGELGITGSAIEGLAQDTGIVDVGFHYGASAEIQGAR